MTVKEVSPELIASGEWQAYKDAAGITVFWFHVSFPHLLLIMRRIYGKNKYFTVDTGVASS